MQFSHLHVHTQFSLLDGAAEIGKLYSKAIKDNMPAMAITDHGNMFGVFNFVAEAYNSKPKDGVSRVNEDGSPKVKPIVGCEFYLVENRAIQSFTKEKRDKRYHQLFLAKNREGYQNLVKLCSLGYMEGLYGKYPRIDKELVLKYHKGLIATTCCLGASVPQAILSKGEDEAEIEFKWWLDIFGEDYYVELQRHNIPDQNKVNEVLLRFAAKYNVKIIASNDSHYVDQADANAHDILLCVNTGDLQKTPKATEEEGGKGYRFGFPSDAFYFKNSDEMSRLFSDVPAAIDNTNEIVSKIEPLKLKQDILLPHFQVPTEFASQDEYLRHLTYQGASQRYKEVNAEVEERLNFELHVIKTMGFAGYFLIVSDFIKAGRELGVLIGPGRGSAAGSAVAYCIGITNIDPIKYNLLFERFLNPDRKSMPDIDTDFDDEGRQKVIDYVVEKYGKNQVAQIVTYGTMAAKSSIKDVARVMDLPLADSNMLAKLVPDKPGIELNRVIFAPLDGEKSLKDKEDLRAEDIENVKKLREIYNGNTLESQVMKEAVKLEGSVRNTGIHAAGIIIAPKDLTDIIPVFTSKDTNLLITQFEGKVIEDAGVIKMDFLGLRTLSIIKEALRLIKENYDVTIDLDTIPLDDAKTFELYQKGETNGTFQFESPGMQKHLKDLRPDKFDDLIAMNALYRPGPIEYIPNFIARKHGREAISYDLPAMEEHLKDTYGITVYQEQVMLLSQKLAGFTKGDADVLRKAMGKKDKATLDKMKSKFMEGTAKHDYDPKSCEKIWTDWEAFAQYAFNKSHSTCYAMVAFQTAYLKSHYPQEYMSALLTNNQSNIDKLAFFMEECKRMGVKVLGPDVNESSLNFSVNKRKEIRVGLGAIKGVGEAAVVSMVEERKVNGNYNGIFDLTRRTNFKNANKKTFEALAFAGAFDCFTDIHRAQYFHTEGDTVTFLEKAMRYGVNFQEGENSSQQSLFGEASEVQIPEPTVPACETWGNIQQLKFEKEVVGMYISGHPLDTYKIEMQFCNSKTVDLADLKAIKGKEVRLGGIMTNVQHKIAKNGNLFGSFVIEDYEGTFSFTMFGKDYLNFKAFMMPGAFVFLRCKADNRWNNPEELELKVQQIQLLEEIKEKMLKNITISLDLKHINERLINEIMMLIEGNPGKCTVKLHVAFGEEKLMLESMSKKFKVNVSNEFLSSMQRIEEIKVQLN